MKPNYKMTISGKLLIALIVVVVGAVIVYGIRKNSSVNGGISNNSSNSNIVIKGIIGSEKMNLFEDQEIKSILKDKYGISIVYSKAGTIEMVNEIPDINQIDFVFPSNQIAVELIKQKYPDKVKKSELILNSPIVIYSWTLVVDKLVKAGIATKTDNVYYLHNLQGLINLIVKGTKWEDIGVTELYGKVNVISTDPTKSNTGIMFAHLLAYMLSDEKEQNDNLDVVLPKLKSIFSKFGYMENSTGNLFEQFLKIGAGAYPAIIGYENQVIEFSSTYKDIWNTGKQKVVVIYPEPTIWSSHPFVCLNDKAITLLNALKDPDIQKIAWKNHGFRSGIIGVQNKVSDISVNGIPENINKLIPNPTQEELIKILNYFQTPN